MPTTARPTAKSDSWISRGALPGVVISDNIGEKTHEMTAVTAVAMRTRPNQAPSLRQNEPESMPQYKGQDECLDQWCWHSRRRPKQGSQTDRGAERLWRY